MYYLLKIVKIYLTPTPLPHPLPPLLKARGKNDIVDIMDSIGILTPLLAGEGVGGEVKGAGG